MDSTVAFGNVIDCIALLYRRGSVQAGNVMALSSRCPGCHRSHSSRSPSSSRSNYSWCDGPKSMHCGITHQEWANTAAGPSRDSDLPSYLMKGYQMTPDHSKAQSRASTRRNSSVMIPRNNGLTEQIFALRKRLIRALTCCWKICV